MRVGARFRHPYDNPQVKMIYAGRPEQYKAGRMAYPHLMLKEKDSAFRDNWGKIRADYANNAITGKQYEKLFFNEIVGAIKRRRAIHQ